MPMVSRAIKNVLAQASTMIQIEKGVRYAKLCSQPFTKYHAMGEAMKNEITTSFKKSFDKSDTMPDVLAPNTLRIPISLMRCSTLNVVSPNKPRQEMKMAMMVKYRMMEASRSSAT